MISLVLAPEPMVAVWAGSLALGSVAVAQSQEPAPQQVQVQVQGAAPELVSLQAQALTAVLLQAEGSTRCLV